MKIIFLFMFIVYSLMAITAKDAAWILDAQTDLTKAYEKAKQEKKKVILLVIVKDGCNWCELMVHKTLKDPSIRENLTDMVTVVIDADSQKLPKEFRAKLTPTLFFINVKNKKSIQKNVGYIKKGAFLIDIISIKEMIE